MAMGNNFWTGLAATLLLLALAVLVAGFPFRFYKGISPSQMRAKVKEDVPLGSNIAFVETYLDASKIEHAPYSKERHDIGAIKRNVCRALLVECSIDIRFYFDDAGLLQRASVEEGFTGL